MKKYAKTILLFGVLLFSSSLFIIAQTTVNYKILKDDPSQKFQVNAGVLADLDFVKDNHRSGYYAKSSLMLGRIATFQGEILFGNPKWDKVSKTCVAKELKGWYSAEGRASLHLKDVVLKKDEKIDLKTTSTQSYNYTYTNTQYIMAPATHREVLGLTGSVALTQRSFQQNNDSVLKIQNTTTLRDTLFPNFGTNSSMLLFSAGFQKEDLVNYIIDATDEKTGERFGKKNSRWRTDVTMEALYTPIVSFDKKLMVNNMQTHLMETYEISNDVRIQHWGFRIRSEATHLTKVGSGARIEVGSRPGIYTKSKDKKLVNWYIQLGLFLCFNA